MRIEKQQKMNKKKKNSLKVSCDQFLFVLFPAVAFK